MRLAELQTRMRQTLLTGGSSDPELLALLADPPPQRERRLAVYRNNVRHALLSVLDAAFPVVRELIGADCFSATTLAFIAQRPPRAPALFAYGGDLPDFLADFDFEALSGDSGEHPVRARASVGARRKAASPVASGHLPLSGGRIRARPKLPRRGA